MAPADLADLKAEWVEPITVNYHGYGVYELPPNTQSFATLIMLDIIEQIGPVLGYDLADLGPRSPGSGTCWWRRRSSRTTTSTTTRQTPASPTCPWRSSCPRSTPRICASASDPEKAGTPRYPGMVISGTVYLTTADRWGNVTSFITASSSPSAPA